MRLLLVEDNPKLADWLERALSDRGYAVDGVQDGSAADRVLKSEPYDAVVLDVNLPGIDGFEVLRRLRQRGSPTPVLLLTARSELPDKLKGLNLGADDYLVKPFELDELEARIKALIRRSLAAGSPTIAVGPLVYDSVTRVFQLHGVTLTLRPREHALLEALTLRAGKPVSKEALFEKVWNLDADASADAVEIYVHRLRKKLESSGVAIVTLRGLGYVLDAAQP